MFSNIHILGICTIERRHPFFLAWWVLGAVSSRHLPFRHASLDALASTVAMTMKTRSFPSWTPKNPSAGRFLKSALSIHDGANTNQRDDSVRHKPE